MNTSLFISHHHDDNAWCSSFAKSLMTYHYDVWCDTESLHGGMDWIITLEKQISQCSIFILVLTPAALTAPWVLEEYKLALFTHRHIIPVILQPTSLEGFIATRHAIMVAGRSPGQVAQEVDQAIKNGRDASPATPQAQWRPFAISAFLHQKGFQGYVIGHKRVLLPPFITIPAGAFLMGADLQRDPHALDNEQPQHGAHLRTYDICSYPVTVAEYWCAVDDGGVREPEDAYGLSWSDQCKIPENPVVNITWTHLLEYATWLRIVTGYSWRLPTEEEWEKAGRGTDGRIFSWGDTWNALYTNVAESKARALHPIGSHPQDSSPYRVMDMVGNVSEWTASRDYPYTQKLASTKAQAPDSELGSHIVRGGNWRDGLVDGRLTRRVCLNDTTIGIGLGGRLAR